MYCISCGKRIAEDSRFCGFCGKEQSQHHGPSSNIDSSLWKKPGYKEAHLSNKNTSILTKNILVVILLLSLLLICLFVMFSKRSGWNTNSESRSERMAVDKEYDYAYEINSRIYVYDKEIKNGYYMIDGSKPCISPCGKELAYTGEDGNHRRQIYVLNLSTKEIRKMSVDNYTCYGPMWSPDGKYIAFNILIDRNWHIGLIDMFDNVNILSRNMSEAFSPTWTFDSQRLILHDMNNIYFFRLDGTIEKELRINELLDFGAASSARFFLTPNGQIIIFNDANDPSGLTESIFSYNLITEEKRKITPEGMNCFSGFYLTNKCDVLFSSYNSQTKNYDTYSISLEGKDPKLLLNNGYNITSKPFEK